MKLNDELTAVANLLRRTRLNAPINHEHKDQLRRRLFDTSKNAHPVVRRLALAASFAIMFVAGVYYLLQPVKPIVGMALYNVNKQPKANIRMNEWVKTGRDSLVIVLIDQSIIHLEPFTECRIESSTTDRKNENAVVYIKRGILDASVPKQLTHALIVKTPDANVRVTGTKFRIEVSSD